MTETERAARRKELASDLKSAVERFEQTAHELYRATESHRRSRAVLDDLLWRVEFEKESAAPATEERTRAE
jgi:hypothetical protein